MSGRAAQGWQTSLADLSLILFMVTAAAVDSQAFQGPSASTAPSVQSEPLAVYADEDGAPPLSVWLDQQSADPRQQVTIIAQYAGGVEAQREALRAATRLVEETGALGRKARVVVEPGPGPTRVVLAYDVPALRSAGPP